MREIKFKAVLDVALREKNCVVSVNAFSIKELASYCEHEWEFKDGSTLPANDIETDDLTYIEYTGLKDKNGKEIWEGDILGFNCLGKLTKMVVDWMPEQGGFNLPCKAGWGIVETKGWAVIGNIYENKVDKGDK